MILFKSYVMQLAGDKNRESEVRNYFQLFSEAWKVFCSPFAQHTTLLSNSFGCRFVDKTY